MKCYYQVLNVPKDSSDEDIKKAYRKLALQWHPDKNPDNVEEAKVQFQLVQQAYEVLGDPNERAWYDRHRESILKGGLGDKYEDKSLDVFPYFTTSCFVGYGDDKKGFYSVYREVFNIIAAEDSEYMSDLDSDYEIPDFGKSDSSFEHVVQPFYAYWSCYSTKKSYAWLNVYDIKEAPNRKVARLMEKENKKVRDEARKERNETIRELVAFVKKRDKRIKAHAEYMKEKRDSQMKKSEQQRRMKVKERNEEIAQYQESEWSKFSNLEKELKDIEANLAAEFGDISDKEISSDEEESKDCDLDKHETLYCVACNKMFKTVKSFQNHENSKKHKENMTILKTNLVDEEETMNGFTTDEEAMSENSKGDDIEIKGSNELNDSLQDEASGPCNIQSVESEIEEESYEKKKRKKKKKQLHVNLSDDLNLSPSVHDSENETDIETFIDLQGQSKKQRKNLTQRKILLEEINSYKERETLESEEKSSFSNEKKNRRSKNKSKISNNKDQVVGNDEECDETLWSTTHILSQHEENKTGQESKNTSCVTCGHSFPSKNKLFDHLKKSGHAVYVGSENKNVSRSTKTKKTLKKK